MVDHAPELIIAGTAYDGWTEIEVVRDIERMSGAFKLSLTDRWPGQPERRAIKPGYACQLRNAGDTLVTGYLDVVNMSYSDGEHSIEAEGRDKTGDLVDCAAVHAGGEWKDQSLAAIARDLIAPFDLMLVGDAPAREIIPRFKIDEGETVFAAIERLCRMKGLLPTSTPAGALRLTKATYAEPSGAALRMGKDGNVLKAEATFNHAERFSDYTVKGQTDGFATPEEETAPMATVEDPQIARHRPTTIIAEDQADSAACEARAIWEASVRAGRAKRVAATVQGWYHSNGLWQPMTLVPVEIPELDIEAELLISAVRYGRSEQDGTTAKLTLADPRAFTAVPPPPVQTDDWGWGAQ